MQSERREEEGNYTWCPSGLMTFFVLKVFIKCLTLIVYPTLTIFVLSRPACYEAIQSLYLFPLCFLGEEKYAWFMRGLPKSE